MNNTQIDPKVFKGLKWRCIGPHRGGRVVAVAGHPRDPMVFYFGACAGGVWKTEDGGMYWQNVSDGFFNSAAVGAIAVSESDPNVIYAGTGESTIRIDVSYGDGVYKSTDGGKTWMHMGLADTHHISKIRVHPQNPDLVYVAALGHAFGPNEERGVFRSVDGGKNWEKVLYKSEKAGAIDLCLDPDNPRILYASIWEAHRSFWTLSSGGEDSGIYKSSDGGDSWTEITDNPGLPKGIKGKIGLAVCPAKPDRVWAIIEAEEAGLYRSDDGGGTWELLTDKGYLISRPWYYCHIFADPKDEETVYVLNFKMGKSTDGGKSFKVVTTPHVDNHDLWIDPQNPQRMIEGNDGGACVSFNGGETWSSIYNQPTAQFYHVVADNGFPYRVYGTQQDNSSISVPSATEKGAITWSDCYPAGTGESGYIAVHPEDANIVYIGAIGSSPGGGGALQRYDHRTRQIRLVTVWPETYFGLGAKDLKYRFAWTYPIVFSPHDPRILYAAANRIFRSEDEGNSWDEISPDLTRKDLTKLEPSGGPITKDTSGAEHYATVYAFVESPHEAGVLWAGSDDGLIHLSKDGGENWQDVTPPDLSEWSLISIIEASPHDPGKVYVAATRYKLDDYRPYLFKTDDYGATWSSIDAGFPDDQITRVIREDPARPGLLYVGTERGIYISFDDGSSWQPLESNLPIVPVYDLVIKGEDLVAATHGRSFWILDDLTPLRAFSEEILGGTDYLFEPRSSHRLWQSWGVYEKFGGDGKNYTIGLGVPTTFYEEKTSTGVKERKFLDAGENPPQGVIVYYLLKDKLSDPLKLTFLDEDEEMIKAFTVRDPEEDGGDESGPGKTSEADSTREDPYLSDEAGLNRFVWDMRYPEADKVAGDVATENSITGPLATPGIYKVRLEVGGETFTQTFEILKDPRVAADQEDLDTQFRLWCEIRDKLSETHGGIEHLRRIRKQVEDWESRIGDGKDLASILEAAAALKAKLAEIEEELIQPEASSSSYRLSVPSRLNFKLVDLISVVGCADYPPPKQAYKVFKHLSAQIDDQLSRLESLIENEVADFNDLVRKADLPAIMT